MQVRQMDNVVNTVLENLSVDRPVGKDVGSYETLNLLLGPDPAMDPHEPEIQVELAHLSNQRMYVLCPPRESHSRGVECQ